MFLSISFAFSPVFWVAKYTHVNLLILYQKYQCFCSLTFRLDICWSNFKFSDSFLYHLLLLLSPSSKFYIKGNFLICFVLSMVYFFIEIFYLFIYYKYIFILFVKYTFMYKQYMVLFSHVLRYITRSYVTLYVSTLFFFDLTLLLRFVHTDKCNTSYLC